MTYENEAAKELFAGKKEEFRAALRKRGLDTLMERRIMRILFATTVEEP